MPMYSACDDRLEPAGFPHSDISGSQAVCRLPEAFRRLPRPSSPLTAKASTVCAYSLDHITPNRRSSRQPKHYMTMLTPIPALLRKSLVTLSRYQRSRASRLYSVRFQIVKERLIASSNDSQTNPIRLRLRLITCQNGGAREDRTPDLLRARQALSQLSYGP